MMPATLRFPAATHDNDIDLSHVAAACTLCSPASLALSPPRRLLSSLPRCHGKLPQHRLIEHSFLRVPHEVSARAALGVFQHQLQRRVQLS